METTNDYLSAAGEFLADVGKVIWDGLVIVGSYLVMFFTWAVEGVSAWIDSIHVPMMPTVSKILRMPAVSGTALALFAIYIITINIISFNMFISDKEKSKTRRAQRTSERSLLGVCFWGGALGGFLGMRVSRHKTLHKKFTVGVTTMLVIQALLFSFIIGFFGFWVYLS